MKLVLLFNTRNRNYTLIDHNLSEREASTQINSLRKQSLPAFTLDQPTPHEGEVEGCNECRKLVENILEKGEK